MYIFGFSKTSLMIILPNSQCELTGMIRHQRLKLQIVIHVKFTRELSDQLINRYSYHYAPDQLVYTAMRAADQSTSISIWPTDQLVYI